MNLSKSSILDNILFLLRNILLISTIIWLFLYLNKVQPTYYIDEVFHIPQTLKYCWGRYNEWDPKITTLPALYFITSYLLKPLNLCNITWIRSVNLITTFFNLYLINSITKKLHSVDNTSLKRKRWIQTVMSYNISFFPPLFFWFFLFYTDVFSTAMVLSMLLLHIHGFSNLAAVPGAISILVRQTNIVWMLLLAAEYCLDIIESNANMALKNLHYERVINDSSLKKIWFYLNFTYKQGPQAFLKFIFNLILHIWLYTLCGISFLIFVIYNQGIVVGDHGSHKPTIHLPQLFYFFIFSFIFAWPYMIVWLKNFLTDIKKHWITSSLVFGLIIIIIHNNTLVHPYILADNRHYVFYFWMKFMNRYSYFRYCLAPCYGFAIYAFYKSTKHVKIHKQFIYFFCLFIVLVPQLLLEPRYFIIPYIFFRLNLKFPTKWQIIFETLTILIINISQFYLFVNKTFYWKDLTHPQRISW